MLSSSSSSSSSNAWMIGRHFHLMSHRSIKTRFAYRFLRALKKLNSNEKKPMMMEKKPTTLSRRKRRSRRYHMVKTAAYVSMASAVGTRRAWSRALLSKIRNRGRTNTILHRHHRHHDQNPNNEKVEEEEATTIQLKKLVPGGEVMDYCSLLDETAHYIKCLTSQVETR